MRKYVVAIAALASAAGVGGLIARATAGYPMGEHRAPSEGEEDNAVAWITANGHAFTPGSTTRADLAPIVQRLNGARIVGLGEATRGTHEDQAFKADLIKELVRSGQIDTIALEANRAPGAAFDRYVRTGEGDPAELVRSDAFFRTAKGDEFAGLLLWLRAWNLESGKPVGIVGVDVQDAGRDADTALDNLARRSRSTARRIRAALMPLMPDASGSFPKFSRTALAMSPGSFDRAMAAVTKLHDRFEKDAKSRAGNKDFDEARAAATAAWQGMNVIKPFKGAPGTATAADYQRRDRYMAANLLVAAGDSHRTALWGHQDRIVSSAPQAFRDNGYFTLGMALREAIGTRYRTVGVTWSRAQVLVTTRKPGDTSMFPVADDKPAELASDGPATFGHEFNQAAAQGVDAMWIDMNAMTAAPELADWRNRTLYKGGIGWLYEPDSWQRRPAEQGAGTAGDGIDVLVWFRRMTPQQRWPGMTADN